MSDTELREKTRTLMFDNIKAGLSPYFNAHYCYVMPSPGNYPFQWWWDTCFMIIILCALGETALAKQNLMSLFRMQEKNGFVGHMIFWESLLPRDKLNILQGPPTLRQLRPHMSALVQPPLIAQALQRIFEETGDKEFVEMMLPKIKKYYRWLSDNRDFNDDGLISIISSFESGIDWKPSFDEVLGLENKKANQVLFRKNIMVDFKNMMRAYNLERIYRANVFIVRETLFNTMYVKDLRALSALCKEVTDDDWKKYADKATKAAKRMIELMYDEETTAFYDICGPDNKQLKVLTFTIGIPILLDEVKSDLAARVIEKHYLNPDEFLLPFPIPSVAKSEPSFDPHQTKFLWRGPTWVVANWFLYHSYQSNGFEKEAKQLLQTVRELIEKSGFREYYNPFNGKGYGAKDFTWSGLVVDMIKR